MHLHPTTWSTHECCLICATGVHCPGDDVAASASMKRELALELATACSSSASACVEGRRNPRPGSKPGGSSLAWAWGNT